MKNKEIDFTAEEFDFLRSLNLNLTYQEKLYFDYDFIINNIDKTPNEILNMEDGLDKRTLLWFDDLFAIKLNEFYGKAYSEHFMNELNSKSVDDLQKDLVAAKKELFNLRFQNATNQLDNTSRIKEVRKNIARIQTVITAKAAE